MNFFVFNYVLNFRRVTHVRLCLLETQVAVVGKGCEVVTGEDLATVGLPAWFLQGPGASTDLQLCMVAVMLVVNITDMDLTNRMVPII